jgi:hypothetical protein
MFFHLFGRKIIKVIRPIGVIRIEGFFNIHMNNTFNEENDKIINK